MGAQVVNSPGRATSGARHCLHIGPHGERCTRPATEDGFCYLHFAGTEAVARRDRIRKLIAIAVGLGALWPALFSLWREINRLRH